MTNRAAIIIGLSVIVAVLVSEWLSPFQTCVRAVNAERGATHTGAVLTCIQSGAR